MGITDKSHEFVLDEISRRERLEHDPSRVFMAADEDSERSNSAEQPCDLVFHETSHWLRSSPLSVDRGSPRQSQFGLHFEQNG